ncbi:hypothetical protein C0991_011627 [Blastosporella zonata]|nr:hypothetical protein C0991_011627 [Blastosporella zonata]
MSKSAEFWLHDGSIVLSVEGTLFRVHQTILTHHSEVFADLFLLPQPANSGAKHDRHNSSSREDSGTDTGEEGGQAGDANETIEGCRVVVLSDDSAADFEDLLGAIYHPSHFDALPPVCDLDDLLSFISGILRLSTKYLIPALRKRCIALLGERFPMTWGEFVVMAPNDGKAEGKGASGKGGRVKDSGRDRDGNNGTTQNDTTTATYVSFPSTVTFHMAPGTTTTPPTSAASALNTSTPVASSSTNAHQPRSRRHSTSHHRDRDHHRERDKPKPKPPTPSFPAPKSSSLMRLITLAHATNVPLILPYAYYLLARTSSPRRFLSSSPSSLSWHIKTLLLVGRTHLHAAQLSLSHAFLIAFAPAPSCSSPDLCLSSRGSLLEWAILCASGKGPEPLRVWERWEKMGVCEKCVGHAKGRHERGREEVWERLPVFFELGSWRSLVKTQDA